MDRYVYGEVDRCLMPVDNREIVRYYMTHLAVAHTRRARLRYWVRGKPAFRSTCRFGASKSSEHLAAFLRDHGPQFFEGTPLRDDPHLDWLVLADHPQSGRSRVVAFPFAPGSARPRAVLKLCPTAAGRGGSLEREWEALRYLDERLPHGLRDTLPRALAYHRLGAFEALLQTHCRGRAMYVDLSRHVFPRRLVRRHLRTAARWLAEFHLATREAERTIDAGVLEESLGGANAPPRLGEMLSRNPIRFSAGHGDYWARNLLQRVDRSDEAASVDPSGVVDWESFRRQAPPWEDLFFFALSYGMNYPWSGYHRLPAEDSFRRTFIEENDVSREVRRYFAVYCARTAIPWDLLEPLLHLHLMRAPRAPDRDPWPGCRELLSRTGPSVFTR